MLWNILITLAAAYAGLTSLLFLFQSRLVYYPEIGGREIRATPEDVGLKYESVSLVAADGVTLHSWFVPARQPRGTVLLLHGNAGNISHRLDWLQMFDRLGYSTLIIDYRGYGKSGGEPSEQGTYLDAEAAWRHLVETRKIPQRRIVLVGESIGGAIAAWLAARHPPGALVIASGFTSVPDLGAKLYPFLPVRLLARIRYDTRESLQSVTSPVFIAHSRDDEIVPFEHGLALYAAAKEPKQFLELSGGHNEGFIFMRESWVGALGDFLDQHLNREERS